MAPGASECLSLLSCLSPGYLFRWIGYAVCMYECDRDWRYIRGSQKFGVQHGNLNFQSYRLRAHSSGISEPGGALEASPLLHSTPISLQRWSSDSPSLAHVLEREHTRSRWISHVPRRRSTAPAFLDKTCPPGAHAWCTRHFCQGVVKCPQWSLDSLEARIARAS